MRRNSIGDNDDPTRDQSMTEPRDATVTWRLLQLVLLAAATWAVNYGRFALGPLQEAMRLDLALTDNQVALLQGPAIALPMALGAIPLGLLADRYSRVHLFVTFAVLNLVAVVLTAFVSNIVVLIAVRCMAGLAFAAILVLAYSIVADLYAPEQRGRATMVVAIGEICGAPAAFGAGGLLLGIAGSAVHSWREALLWMCVPLLPIALSMLALREPPRAGSSIRRSPLREVWVRLWHYRSVFMPLLLARIMVWIADGAVLVWGAPAFSRGFGVSPERTGGIMAAALLIAGLVGPLLGGPLADFCQRKGGPRRTMAALSLLALLTVPAALFSIMPNVGLASVFLTAFLTLGFIIGTAAIALATIVIPSDLRGLFVAIQITVGAAFSIGVAPVVVSSLSGALGGPAMIGQALAIVCATTSLLSAFVFGLGKQHFPGIEAQYAVRNA